MVKVSIKAFKYVVILQLYVITINMYIVIVLAIRAVNVKSAFENGHDFMDMP